MALSYGLGLKNPLGASLKTEQDKIENLRKRRKQE